MWTSSMEVWNSARSRQPSWTVTISLWKLNKVSSKYLMVQWPKLRLLTAQLLTSLILRATESLYKRIRSKTAELPQMTMLAMLKSSASVTAACYRVEATLSLYCWANFTQIAWIRTRLRIKGSQCLKIQVLLPVLTVMLYRTSTSCMKSPVSNLTRQVTQSLA